MKTRNQMIKKLRVTVFSMFVLMSLGVSSSWAQEYTDESGRTVRVGVAPNELTASEDRDWLAGTPWHKHTAAQIEAI